MFGGDGCGGGGCGDGVGEGGGGGEGAGECEEEEGGAGVGDGGGGGGVGGDWEGVEVGGVWRDYGLGMCGRGVYGEEYGGGYGLLRNDATCLRRLVCIYFSRSFRDALGVSQHALCSSISLSTLVHSLKLRLNLGHKGPKSSKLVIWTAHSQEYQLSHVLLVK